MLSDLLKKNRSYRRFCESERIPQEQLEEWVGLMRFCASARNAHPERICLRFCIYLLLI